MDKLKDIDNASALVVGLTLVAELANQVAMNASLLGQLPPWVFPLVFVVGATVRGVLKSRTAPDAK